VGLVRPGSGRWGPSLTTPHSGVWERLSNPSMGQPSNSRSSVSGADPRVQSHEEPSVQSAVMLFRPSSSCRQLPSARAE
jgi:hypothetical protein